jgi:hypothetical protein
MRPIPLGGPSLQTTFGREYFGEHIAEITRHLGDVPVALRIVGLGRLIVVPVAREDIGVTGSTEHRRDATSRAEVPPP